MDKFLRTIDRGLVVVSSIGVRVSGVCLVLTFVLINIEVMGRYVFGFSTLVADEYGSYFFVWMTFLGFAETLRRGQFLRVKIILDHVPPRIADVMQGFASLASSVLCGILAYCVSQTFYMSALFGSVSLAFSRTPLVLPQIVMPFALGLLALVFLNEGIRRLRSASIPAESSKGPVR